MWHRTSLASKYILAVSEKMQFALKPRERDKQRERERERERDELLWKTISSVSLIVASD